MHANRKIILIIFAMVSVLTFIIAALIAMDSRESGFESAKKRAYVTAEIVQKALTAHMVNGMIDKRDVFLESMRSLENVRDLWIVRSESVNRQFGAATLAEAPRDAVDAAVLESGKEQIHITETLEKATLRITIPYTASSLNKPNCLSCHHAQEGEVLGAISLRFDIQDDRIAGILSLAEVVGTSVLFLALIMFIIGRMIKPYTSMFDAMTHALRRVHDGDYSVRINTGVYQEDKEAAMWLNEIVEKLDTVLGGIEKNLTAFVHNRSTSQSNDKLLSAQEIIRELAEIYNFKKTIETDARIEDIYYRLEQVLSNKMGLKHFVLFEDELQNDRRSVVCRSQGCSPCCDLSGGLRDQCRAERTGIIVQSDHFPDICRAAEPSGCSYICIPFPVSEERSLVLSIVCRNPEELEHAKYQIGIIKKYMEEATPILESRMLTDILRRSNFVDGLTQLYNRKYLDEFIDRQLPAEQSRGNHYAVMLLDVDYFKMVNDTYGHDAGDAILKRLSKTMSESVGDEDFVVRFGGEEFLILLRNPTEESAAEIARNINAAFAKVRFKFNGEEFSKTVSIGYAFYPEDTDKIWHCIKYADLCLYEAKETGRNKIVRFEPRLLKNSEGY